MLLSKAHDRDAETAAVGAVDVAHDAQACDAAQLPNDRAMRAARVEERVLPQLTPASACHMKKYCAHAVLPLDGVDPRRAAPCRSQNRRRRFIGAPRVVLRDRLRLHE